MICKCGHADYIHHEITGKCEAVRQKIIADYKISENGIAGYVIESEVLGDCNCVRLVTSNHRFEKHRLPENQTRFAIETE